MVAPLPGFLVIGPTTWYAYTIESVHQPPALPLPPL